MVGLKEEIGLLKERVWQDEVFVRGKARVHKYRRGEAAPYEVTPFVNNTIVNAGFDAFLEMVAGVDTRAFDAASTRLHLLTSAGGNSRIFDVAGVTEVTATKPAPSVAFRWLAQDNSSDSYQAEQIELRRFQAGEQDIRFNNIVTGWGSKPSSENWTYELILEIYSSNANFQTAGLRRLGEAFTGGRAAGSRFEAGNIRLQPLTSTDAAVGSAIAPTGATLVDIAGRSLRWEFNSADGQHNGTWTRSRVQQTNPSAATLRQGGCKQDGSSCGTKAAGEAWKYTYTLTFSQGS